ncbi:FAD-dependent oxidoreductase [Mesorhizobium sp. M1217]|uniref:FAD-dependent oxidoreductase n=1 Tax=Mesorhizobium sp. M1217 TaxID=2957070 RepID=UPI0033391C6D
MLIHSFGSVASLWRYPVSSLAGQRVQELKLGSSGADGDRLFGLYETETGDPISPSAKGASLTPPMLFAQLDTRTELSLSLDGREWFRADSPNLQALLADLFGRSVSIVRYGTDIQGRLAQSRYKMNPIHLVSVQAIERLQRILPESQIDIRRFRPNIVLDMPTFDDYELPEYALLGQEFKIGDAVFKGSDKCGRCSFTTFELPGIPADRRVLRTLMSDFEKHFGIYCNVVSDGSAYVGAGVTPQYSLSSASSIVVIGADGQIDVFGDEKYPPYERPPLSKNFLVDDTDEVKLTQVLSPHDSNELDVNLHVDQPVLHIDRTRKTVELLGNKEIPYDKLVIATGGTARKLLLTNRGFGRVHSVRTAEDARNLRRAMSASKSIFIVGAGWLGLEIAATARATSIDVTLFGRQPYLCSRVLPKVVAEYLAQQHLSHGVKLRLGEVPSFTEMHDRVEARGEQSVDSADLLVVAIGMDANDHLARRAGLQCADGIITDYNGATDDPSVFAIGDVSRQNLASPESGVRIESWQNAIDQSRRAARAMMGMAPEQSGRPRFWSDQYNLTLQIVGFPKAYSEPQSESMHPFPFWQFANFAIGVNRPREIHQYASTFYQRSQLTETVDDIADDKTRYSVTNKHWVGKVGLVLEGQMVRIPMNETGHLALIFLEQKYYAIQDQCPHATASLSEGFLEGRRVVCPIHFAEFDFVTGAPFNAPKGCGKATTYRVEVERDDLYVHVPLSQLSFSERNDR